MFLDVLWPGIRKSLGLKKWRYTLLYNFFISRLHNIIRFQLIVPLSITRPWLSWLVFLWVLKLSCVKTLHLHFKTGQLQIILFTLPASLSCAKRRSKITFVQDERWPYEKRISVRSFCTLHLDLRLIKTYSVLYRATEIAKTVRKWASGWSSAKWV